MNPFALLAAVVLLPIFGVILWTCGALIIRGLFVETYWGWITLGMFAFVTLTCIPGWIRQWRKKRKAAALSASAKPQLPASDAR